MAMWQTFHSWAQRFASPAAFERLQGRCLRYLQPLGWLSFIIALYWGLVLAPMDYQQKDAFRIIYIHVPAAALSLSIYVMLASASFCYFVWRWSLAAIFARAAAPYGALMTFLALVTGAIWGKPTWGTYWTWDARLTSELLLFFLYLAYILLQNSFDDRATADRLASILAMIGLINIPIIHYSVVWWNSLHQGATLFKLGAPSIAPAMLYPLLLMLFAFYVLFFVFQLRQMHVFILEKQRQRLLEE